MNFILGSVKIEILNTDITFEEAKRLAEIEIEEAEFPLNRIRIGLDSETDEYIVQAFRKSPITRIRRITGYLSDIHNFNEAKKAESDDRLSHQKAENEPCANCGSRNTHIQLVLAFKDNKDNFEHRIICDNCGIERRI